MLLNGEYEDVLKFRIFMITSVKKQYDLKIAVYVLLQSKTSLVLDG